MGTTTAESNISPRAGLGSSAASIAAYIALAATVCLCILLLIYCASQRMRGKRHPPPVPKKNRYISVLSTAPIARLDATTSHQPVLAKSAPQKPPLGPWPLENGHCEPRKPDVAFRIAEPLSPTDPAPLKSRTSRHSVFRRTHQPLGESSSLESDWPQPLQPGRPNVERAPERRPWPGSSRGSSWYSRPSWCSTIFEEEVAEDVERDLGASPGPTIRSVEAAVGNYSMVSPTLTHEGRFGILSTIESERTYNV